MIIYIQRVQRQLVYYMFSGNAFEETYIAQVLSGEPHNFYHQDSCYYAFSLSCNDAINIFQSFHHQRDQYTTGYKCLLFASHLGTRIILSCQSRVNQFSTHFK
jgi:hypothetical protein